MSDLLPVEGTIPVTWRARYHLILPREDAPAGGFPVLLALHGFGEDGPRFAALIEPLEQASYARLYLDGPFPVEMRREDPARVGHAWYQYTGDQAAFRAAIEFGEEYLRSALDRVAGEHPIDPRRVVPLGYSQGGYLAGVAALRDPERYRGLVAIATRIKTEFLEEELPHRRGYPVLAIHGENDRSTRIEPQREAVAALCRHGVDAVLSAHAGGHGLRREVCGEIDQFVRRVLKTSSEGGR